MEVESISGVSISAEDGSVGGVANSAEGADSGCWPLAVGCWLMFAFEFEFGFALPQPSSAAEALA